MAGKQSKIEYLKTSDLIPYARNSRTHSELQVNQIAGSIKEFGFNNPILIDADNGIIAGHGRVLAADKLGMAKLPCVRLLHLSEVQKRAYIIADNNLALNAEWDADLLGLELEDLKDSDFDLDLLGFDAAELEGYLNEVDATDLPNLNDGDKPEFQQITFLLHDDQHSVLSDALTLARTNPVIDTGLNDNSNGNAIAFICEQWLKANG